jgi:ketosteroid isomerase-like protein
MNADRAFAKATAEKGLEGWLSFMTEDAVRVSPLGGKAHVGKAAVRALDKALFADPKRRLVWEPTDAGVFADRKHGFSTGRFRMAARKGDGVEDGPWTGSYVTWWRRENGRWRVILDTGAPDAPKQ